MLHTVAAGTKCSSRALRLRFVLSKTTTCRLLHSNGPAHVFKEHIDKGLIQKDPHQLVVVDLLQKLHDDIVSYTHNSPAHIDSRKKDIEKTSFFGNWFGGSKPAVDALSTTIPSPPRGLYLWGGTGSGKTFLMDLFFENLPIAKKERVHFHNFMISVHKSLYKLKNKNPTIHSDEMMSEVVDDVIRGAKVVCFDEFQVTDIADAMILKSLFSKMFDKNVVLIATSNRPPQDLYKNGLQRSLFLPFIDLLTEKVTVHSIAESKRDYRLLKNQFQAKNSFLFPLNPDNQQNIESQFKALQQYSWENSHSLSLVDQIHSLHPIEVKSLDIQIYGHQVRVPQWITGRPVAHFQFNDLCSVALGAADYIEIAKLFRVVFISNVPKMNLNFRNELRRFITCIDAFYEAKVQVVITAEGSPVELLQLSTEEKRDSVFDEVFAFDRTVSRLLEMQSLPYLQSLELKMGPDLLHHLCFGKEQISSSHHISQLVKTVWDHYFINCQLLGENLATEMDVAVLKVFLHDLMIVLDGEFREKPRRAALMKLIHRSEPSVTDFEDEKQFDLLLQHMISKFGGKSLSFDEFCNIFTPYFQFLLTHAHL